ncbi:uncharacterized protein HKW66_Vig0052420 [Vigna angularis]|uniref:Uncharacterized protein n=1 Tax=Phaseolus angularis TaxID=3914 RepID=A0A8T0L1C8_PHAAN|nr:uncharacterized protein HKW66_Vig0052420 [Vigna angularis]
MSAFPNGSNSNLDNLLLQTMMGRLQLRAPINNPLVTQSLEDFLFNDLDEDDADEESFEGKSELVREEAKLEKEVIKIILSGNGESLLKPNSGQAVSVRDHHICVGFQDEEASGYRVWEWHGHIMAFDEEFGYNPEYIYGNYFQWFKPRPGCASAAVADPVVKKEEEEEEEEEKQENQGLRELIETKDSADARILHRNINAASPRLYMRNGCVWLSVTKLEFEGGCTSFSLNATEELSYFMFDCIEYTHASEFERFVIHV